jgi:microcystin-dependent protein
MHFSAAHTLGERGGEEAHTLSVAEMPRHDHDFNATSTGANSNVAAGGTPAAAVAGSPLMYTGAGGMTPLNPGAIHASGGSQPHDNMQPSLALNFIIALQGIFPSQN